MKQNIQIRNVFLKLSSRLPFYISIVLIEEVSQSFIALAKFPEDEKTISCSNHQIPRMLWEYYRIALTTRKMAYHTQQGHTSNPGCLVHFSGTTRGFTAAADLSQSLQSRYQCDGGFTPRSDLLNVYSCCPACKRAGTLSSFLILPARLFHKHSLENSLCL